MAPHSSHLVPLDGVQVRELQRQGNASLVMALAGNKADLTEKRKVDAEVRAAEPRPASCQSALRSGPPARIHPSAVSPATVRARALSRPLSSLCNVGEHGRPRPQEAQAYADENGLYFMETSAKSSSNVNGARLRRGACAACPPCASEPRAPWAAA